MFSETWQHDGHTAGDPIVTHTDLYLEEHNEVRDALTTLLADLFALYVKTKVFHRRASGLGPRGRRLLLAEQADQILVTIDTIGERVGVPGSIPIRPIGEISRPHRIGDSAPAELTMREMLAALLRDSRLVARQMRRMCARCRAHGDLVSARLLEDWIDETEGRYWFLFEMHRADRGGAAYRPGGSDVN
jgi:starvation-inducible DNA-binding protein